ncbi:hypothetical protein HNP71_002775 [Acidocella aromatica]|uniref:Uncharacterized protein n=1 Tax=Acidocella aromatica TaxID=1303579 RepID=A0A840VT57_9PROT|nr:hypothetical protein [Acidocella aromatica]
MKALVYQGGGQKLLADVPKPRLESSTDVKVDDAKAKIPENIQPARR